MDNNEFFKKVQEECKNMDIYNTDWHKVRIQAAIAAMQGMLSNPSSVSMKDEVIIQESAMFADALVEELKGE